MCSVFHSASISAVQWPCLPYGGLLQIHNTQRMRRGEDKHSPVFPLDQWLAANDGSLCWASMSRGDDLPQPGPPEARDLPVTASMPVTQRCSDEDSRTSIKWLRMEDPSNWEEREKERTRNWIMLMFKTGQDWWEVVGGGGAADKNTICSPQRYRENTITLAYHYILPLERTQTRNSRFVQNSTHVGSPHRCYHSLLL